MTFRLKAEAIPSPACLAEARSAKAGQLSIFSAFAFHRTGRPARSAAFAR
jgi:hypothetical protein